MTISTTVLAITGVFGGGGGAGGLASKEKRTLKKWLDRLADALKRLAGKAAEALPAIVGSVIGAMFPEVATHLLQHKKYQLHIFFQKQPPKKYVQKQLHKFSRFLHKIYTLCIEDFS